MASGQPERARGERLNWGIMSTARISGEVMPGMQRSSRNTVRAVGSRDRARADAFAQEYGLPVAYGSYEELLGDPQIDCLYVCLPNSLHEQWTRAALEAGKHVLCEKPITPAEADARALYELAVRHGLVLAEAFMYRHHPKARKLRELVRSGALGDIRTIRCSFNFMVGDPCADIRYDRKLAGGSLLDVGSYCVSLSNYLQDDQPAEVSATARNASSGVPEQFYGTMTYRSGAVAIFDCAMNAPLSIRASVLGSAGEAVVEVPWYPHLPPPTIDVWYSDGRSEHIEASGKNAYFLETEDFAASVRGEKSPEIPPAETLRNLRTLERLQASADQHGTSK
jgi:D-xylose 1-dehydrogenase (NADP+, D-xylono-1,5-lactone-forming)